MTLPKTHAASRAAHLAKTKAYKHGHMAAHFAYCALYVTHAEKAFEIGIAVALLLCGLVEWLSIGEE